MARTALPEPVVANSPSTPPLLTSMLPLVPPVMVVVPTVSPPPPPPVIVLQPKPPEVAQMRALVAPEHEGIVSSAGAMAPDVALPSTVLAVSFCNFA